MALQTVTPGVGPPTATCGVGSAPARRLRSFASQIILQPVATGLSRTTGRVAAPADPPEASHRHPASRHPAQAPCRPVLSRAGLLVVVFFAVAIGTLNLASLLSNPAAELALEGVAALAAGRWCALNFWRCRQAHCLVTGIGWLGLSLLAFVEAGLGHSAIGGYERGVFVVVFAIGCVFEAAWQITRGTNATT
jgi:hypothetical protein